MPWVGRWARAGRTNRNGGKTMNANEIVKVLRTCGKGMVACIECPYYIANNPDECRYNAMQDAANEINHLKAEIYGQADRIQSLQAQLRESQCRADAAVEDMKHIANKISQCKGFLSGGEDRVQDLKLGRCDVCKGICYRDEPCKFEWRGPQEG
jgi:septal ring factor EnvC (AmiA/AmiB activator)